MNIKDLIDEGIKKLNENNIDDSVLKSKKVLEYVLNQNKSYLVAHYDEPVEEKFVMKYKKHLQDLILGKPLQYITNSQEFMGLDFYVDENVLIPQPDTECLVEEAIKELMKLGTKKIRVLDLCTGSGAIAISILKHMQKYSSNINIYASDISDSALKIAEMNARKNGVKIELILSNMFDDINKFTNEKFDIIISNPPYIKTNEIKILPKDVQSEPHIALDGGIDGLDFYKIIAENVKYFFRKKGKVLLEIGHTQKEDVTQLFNKYKCYKNISCIKDLSNKERVLKIEYEE